MAAFPGLSGLVTEAERLVFDLGASICIISLMISGIMRILAFGSERRTKMANAALVGVIFGFLVILLAFPVTNWLQNELLRATRP